MKLETKRDGKLITPPCPSANWAKINKNKKKNMEGFLPEDMERSKWPLAIKDGWKDLKFLYQIDERKTFWKELSEALEKDLGNILQRKYSKAFKVVLALSQTPPLHLPKAVLQDGKTLIPDSLLSEIWLASVTVFGFTKIPLPVLFTSKEKSIPNYHHVETEGHFPRHRIY